MHRLGDLIIVALLAWGIPCFAQADALKRAGAAVHGSDDRDEPERSRTETRRDSHSHSESSDRREAAPREERHRSHGGHRGHRGHHSYRASAWDNYDDDDDHELEKALGRGLVQVLFFPWTVPLAVVREYNTDGYSVPVYPYADELAYSRGGEAPSDVQRIARLVTTRMRLGATARNPHLVSGTVATQLDFAFPLSLHLDYRLLAEAEGGERNYAGLGNAEVLYRFAEASALRFFSGAGYVQWADAAGLGHGFGLIYGFEAFPIRPISFGSRVSIGMLGQSYAFQWRSHIGVLMSRYELQLAYDHVDVGGAQLGGLQLSFGAHL